MSPLPGIYASQISGHLSAPQGAYDALASVTLSATASSVTFAGIPSGYKHLQIRSIARDSSGGGSVDNGSNLTFNGDTGNNYSWHALFGQGASATASATPSTNRMLFISAASGSTANVFTGGIYDILDYASTTKYKTGRQLTGEDLNGSGGIYYLSGLWMNTAPITSLTITCTTTFAIYSSFALYGVK